MRKLLTFAILAFLMGLFPGVSTAQTAPPEVNAYSAVLIDSVTGKVLYEKRCHVRRPPASTTKIMTAILAVENGTANDTVSASRYATKTPFGSLNLRPGEQMTLHDALYGMLLRSANDAAVCVAENVAGSEKSFVQMMNEKAKEIGANDTHFVNPHGLYNRKHYSTAYDLALIARYATRYSQFNDIVRTKARRLDRSLNKRDVTVRNTAKFLWKYEGADGIKTGYTREAGHCFVGSATRNGWRLISVVLKSKQCGEDTTKLIQYGFDNFKPIIFAKLNRPVTTVDVRGGVSDKVEALPVRDLGVVLRKNDAADSATKIDLDKVSAPIKKGQKMGTLTGYVHGESVGSVDLVAAESVDRTLAATAWFIIRWFFTITVTLLLGLIVYGTTASKIARRRRRRVKTRRREVDLVRPRSGQWQSRYSTRSQDRP
ncbi:MAG TPA: D-alanyl-D-alanine carboxypeptidase family protein [Armatimonadota bacterium]